MSLSTWNPQTNAFTGTPGPVLPGSLTDTDLNAMVTYLRGLIGSGGSASLAPATANALGGVKIGAGLTATPDGTISVLVASGSYTLPPATALALGGVKAGSGVNIAQDGTLTVAPYSLPPASANLLGGVKAGTGVTIAQDGTLNVSGGGGTTYTLPPATSSVLGGVKAGSGLAVASDGTLSTTGTGGTAYTLPPATALVLGGIKVGTGLSIATDGTLTATGSGGTASVTGVPTVTTLTTATDTALLNSGGATKQITFDNLVNAITTPIGALTAGVAASSTNRIAVDQSNGVSDPVYVTFAQMATLFALTAMRTFTGTGACAVTAADGTVIIKKAAPAATSVILEPTPATGAVHTIKDGLGDAATNNITVTTADGKQIDGASSFVLNINRQSVTFQYNGTEWSLT